MRISEVGPEHRAAVEEAARECPEQTLHIDDV
ncbi:ferredoxin [Streptomyces gilvus]